MISCLRAGDRKDVTQEKALRELNVFSPLSLCTLHVECSLTHEVASIPQFVVTQTQPYYVDVS